jgi:hypothetical protein
VETMRDDDVMRARGGIRTRTRPLLKRPSLPIGLRARRYQGRDLHPQPTGSEPASSAGWDTLANFAIRTGIEPASRGRQPRSLTRCLPDQRRALARTRTGTSAIGAPDGFLFHHEDGSRVRLARTTSGLTGRRLCFEATLEWIESARRESNPVRLTGGQACSQEHFARVGAPGRICTGMRSLCRRSPSCSVHGSRPWSPREDSNLQGLRS